MSAMNLIREIGRTLEELAKQQRTINYIDIVRRYDLPDLSRDWSNHPLSGIFHVLDLEDYINGRLFITSLVVNERDSRPGKGFFETAFVLRRFQGPLEDSAARESFWIGELSSLFTHWRNQR